jgi:hypothetical protein
MIRYILIILLLVSCNGGMRKRVIEQGYNSTDSSYYVKISDGDSVRTYYLDKELWYKYRDYQLSKLGK